MRLSPGLRWLLLAGATLNLAPAWRYFRAMATAGDAWRRESLDGPSLQASRSRLDRALQWQGV